MAHATVLAVVDDGAAGWVYNVGEPDALSLEEWIQAIGRAAGWNREVISLPADQLPDHRRSDYNWEQNWIVDTSRIRAELAYSETISREEALRRTVDWWRQASPDEVSEPFNPKTSPDDYAAEDAVLSGYRARRS